MTGRRLRMFTLIELMAVVTLMVIAIGISTLNVGDMSDAAGLRTTSMQIGALCRLAVLEARTTGLPRVIRYGATSLRLRKPVYAEGVWTWSTAPPIVLDSKVRIVQVTPLDGRIKTESQSTWDVAIQPGEMGAGHMIELKLRNGRRAIVQVDPYSGKAEVRAQAPLES